MPRCEVIAPMAAAVMFLTKAPRTVSEVAKLLKVSRDPVARYFRALEAEGLVRLCPERRKNPRGRTSPVWEWIA